MTIKTSATIAFKQPPTMISFCSVSIRLISHILEPIKRENSVFVVRRNFLKYLDDEIMAHRALERQILNINESIPRCVFKQLKFYWGSIVE